MMKRPLILSLLLISVDQFLKYFFQSNYHNKIFLLTKNFGFTFVTNPGIYLDTNISNLTVVLLQIFIILTVFFVVYIFYQYKLKTTKDSFLIDLAFSFLLTGLIGNLLIDRIIYGHIRDYIILPFGIANLADFGGVLAVALIMIELIRNESFRNIVFKQQESILNAID